MERRHAGTIVRAGVIALALLAAGDVAAAPKRVLILHSFGQQFEPFRSAAAAFRSELASRSPDPIEFHEIALETARFAEGAVDEPLAEYLRASYAEDPPDLVVSIASPAARFWVRHRERVLPDVPFLAAAIEERHLSAVDLGADATAVTFRFDDAGFAEDLLRLLPETERIVVVYGASPLEKFWVAETRRAWQPLAGRVELVWLDELPFPEIAKRVASLPLRSAVVFGMMSVDAAGVPYDEHAALERLRAEASAPIFGFIDEQLGRGIVGGRGIATRELGAESARTALRILGGESPGTLPLTMVPPTAPAFDARELGRWSIPEERLPAGSEVLFREPSLWEAHRMRIVSVGLFVALQMILIVVLLRSRQRLRAARAKLAEDERNLQELRRELSHAGRVSLLGQVTASLAHELGQPLGAILRNSDAAELLLKNDRLDLDELRAILADVRRDGHRAGAVITRLRALLERRAIEMQVMTWSEVVGEVLDIVRGDAQAREIVLERDVPTDLPPARGDRVHLQQVLLNLVANAMDALDGNGQGERRVTVRACRRDEGWIESAVHDTGRGISPRRLATVFDPFVTTKPNGMGMGLPISRSIVEAHGGRIWAENDAGGGTTFRFTVPAGAAEQP